MLQINILNSLIIKNNFIFVNTNKIFSNNINYISGQRKNIKKRINFANFSLMKERNILYNMKNLLNNHKYNYLYFFQLHKYYLPKITTIGQNNKINSIFDIKNNTSKLNKQNANINNISAQSKEELIGVKSINSLVSSSKNFILFKNNLLQYLLFFRLFKYFETI